MLNGIGGRVAQDIFLTLSEEAEGVSRLKWNRQVTMMCEKMEPRLREITNRGGQDSCNRGPSSVDFPLIFFLTFAAEAQNLNFAVVQYS